jgi:purine nucleosidase
MNKKVLFFGDPGIDDTIALLYAHFSGKIDIVGIVTDYGSVKRDLVIKNAYFILQSLGKKDIPVIVGAEYPLTAKQPQFYTDVHGVHGLGKLIPDIKLPKLQENFFEVIDIINKYKDELIIVNTGRLTSLSSLFVLYGDLMKQVKSYYIMGGAFLVPGNVTPIAEANFYVDPVAANIVMRYAQNVTIFPLNVTMKAIVTPEMVNYIDQKGKTKLVKPLLDFYYDFYKKTYPYIKGSPAHDALTISGVINEEMFMYIYSPVEVVTNEGPSMGQSIADFRPYVRIIEERPIHRIAVDLNYALFYEDFMTIMT